MKDKIKEVNVDIFFDKFLTEKEEIVSQIDNLKRVLRKKKNDVIEAASEKIFKEKEISNLEEYLETLNTHCGVLAYSCISYSFNSNYGEREDFETDIEIPEEAEILFEIFNENEDKQDNALDFWFFDTNEEFQEQYTQEWNYLGLALSKIFNRYMTFQELEKRLVIDKEFFAEVQAIAEKGDFEFVKEYLGKISEPGEYQKKLMLESVLAAKK